MLLLKLYIIGIIVLISAIGLNVIANFLSLETWYEFIKAPGKTTFWSYVWLFVIYPFCLGLAGYVTSRLLN